MNKNQVNKKIEQLLKEGSANLVNAQKLADQIRGELPDEQELKSKLASVCLEIGLFETAIELFQACLQDDPNNTLYLGFLGIAQARAHEISRALDNLYKAVEADETNWYALTEIGSLLSAQGQSSKSLEYLQKAHNVKPGSLAVNQGLASAYIACGDLENGLKFAEKAYRMNTKDPDSLNILGLANLNIGEMDQAVKYFEMAIKVKPDFGSAWYNLSTTKRFKESDRDTILKLEKKLTGSLSVEKRYKIEFALGEMYDSLKEWQKSFDHFHRANTLAKNYQREEDIDFDKALKVLKKTFNKSSFSESSPSLDSEKPVFVVGMPRSGTTLMEQIIASHSKGAGAGELEYVNRFVLTHVDFSNPGKAQEDFKQLFDNKQDDIREFYEDYLSRLSEKDSDADRVCDKMPRNFIHLGAIHKIFPKARIIHMRRSPVDTCLSCYFKALINQPWSFDIDKIANYYEFYSNLMDHWHKVLPENTILDVKYEDLISNPEQISREVIDFIGLDWEPGCLDFHQKKNVVITASAWQVRQPMYKSSVNRWSRYGDKATPFFNKLYNYIDPEEIALAKKEGLKVKAPGLLTKILG